MSTIPSSEQIGELVAASDAKRDADAPGFLAQLRKAYGSLDGLDDVLAMLGLEAS